MCSVCVLIALATSRPTTAITVTSIGRPSGTTLDGHGVRIAGASGGGAGAVR
jgi:hypothetical protein